ncbi:MAG: hypothetical protein OZ948_12160 [Deltaproteobacteria bacterium]|nr:hypothetical protein [Deltaproteobacteria bacterium]
MAPPPRMLLLALLPLASALACEQDPFGPGELSPADAAAYEARIDAFLDFATAAIHTTSQTSAIAHMEREAREPMGVMMPGTWGPDAWDADFARIAAMEDTTDFTLLYMLNAYLGYHPNPAVAPELWQKTADAFLSFKFWYTDPQPEGIVDDKWYWSENHQIIFHTLEYLIGQEFPEATFTITGWTGAQHRERAAAWIRRWLDHKARFGFDEWHSNVYYQKDVTPLLTLVEFADDPEIATGAAILLDRVLLDIALHSFRGAFGATHGRSYKKDKMTALDEDTFGLAKLLFDQTEYPYPAATDAGAVLLARAKKYRLPQLVLDVARSQASFADRERMGIALDEDAPLVPDGEGGYVVPPGPYGFDFSEEYIHVWWAMSALITWPVIPKLFDVADRYDLWESELFLPYAALKAGFPDAATAMPIAQLLAASISGGLNEQVNTYTWRTPDYMLSSAQDYRKGYRGFQYHSWQLTFDANAQIFTTHPGHAPRHDTSWGDDGEPGDWTGTASQPRSAQHENVAIHLYAPQYQPLAFPPADAITRYEPYTHAYLPQDHFDEVVRDGHWTFARFRDGYVGLYSWRLAEFVDHGPEVPNDGMTLPWDLVASGGPDNVWIVECGRAADWGSFQAFRDALRAAPVTVTAATTGLPAGTLPPFFTVSYGSPSQGTVEFAWTGPLVVAGSEVPITGYPRMDNPWVQIPFEERNAFFLDAETGSGLLHFLGNDQVEGAVRTPFRVQ